MLVQALVVINGAGAITVLAYYGAAHNPFWPREASGSPDNYSLLSRRVYRRFRRPLYQKNNSGMIKFLGA
jgi:hypothetical protein